MYSCVLSLHWAFCFCSMGTFIFVWMWVTRYPYNMKDTSLYHVSVLLFLSVYPQIICFSQEAATYNTSQLDIQVFITWCFLQYELSWTFYVFIVICLHRSACLQISFQDLIKLSVQRVSLFLVVVALIFVRLCLLFIGFTYRKW